MQEYSSVAVSSYKAGDLSTLLNEQAQAGWTVVSIIAAGTEVVAYLTRDAESAAAPATAVVDHTSPDVEGADVGAVGEAPAVVDMDDAADAAADADSTVDDDAAAVAAAEEATDVASEAAAVDAVDEPAGWAIAPDTAAAAATVAAAQAGTDTTDAAAEAATDLVPDSASVGDASSDAADSVVETPTSVAPVASVDTAAAVVEPSAAAATPATPTAPAAAAPAAESTVPAGWYADPSGRYELRYWDGTAWTEHVSRSGQQFTDPPVA